VKIETGKHWERILQKLETVGRERPDRLLGKQLEIDAVFCHKRGGGGVGGTRVLEVEFLACNDR